METLPTAEQVASGTTWFTSQAGISSTILAVFCIVIAAVLVWMIREHKKERAEIRSELFGNKAEGVVGVVPDLIARVEKLRTESWASIDAMMGVQSEHYKDLEERRRQDGIGHHVKLDRMIAEVMEMSNGDLQHHNRIESKVAHLEGSFQQMSARLSDMITLAAKLAPAPFDGTTERREPRRRGK